MQSQPDMNAESLESRLNASGSTRLKSRGASMIAIAAMLTMAAAPAYGQEAVKDKPGLDVIVVTAQKRSENLQDVPVSLQVLSSEQLQQQHVSNFEDYAALLPSVSFSGQGPGNSQVFMRGISSGGDGNKSGTSPSVAIYLDDQPVTSIGRILDVQMYDIARVESAAGPQGTLYGAGSQAGTLRIITNAPSTSGFEGGVDLSLATTKKGDPSYTIQGFVNVPLGDNAALRLVGWRTRDGGYIDNVPSTLTFTAQNITVDNAAYVKEDFNVEENTGARVALKVDLNDNWSATARVMHQRQKTNGVWDHDPEDIGDLQVARFFDDSGKDEWTQAALTVEGDLGGVQLTYAGSYLDRKVEYNVDYSAYSEYSAYIPYYTCYSTGALDFSTCTDPREQFDSDDTYKVMTHELRLQNDESKRLRFIAGMFYQRAKHDYLNIWHIPSIPASRSVNANSQLSGYPDDAYFITDQLRTETEIAGFGEVSFDFTDTLTATVGARAFKTESKLNGAVGTLFSGSPLIDLASSETGQVYKANISYKPNSDLLFYATFSQGFRPGGNNRASTSNIPGVYKSDKIDNYEIGWKTTLAGGNVRWNGSIFNMDWKNIQISRFDPAESFLGLTANVGNARSRGVETDLSILLSEGFQINAAASYIDAKIITDYVRNLSTGNVDAPAGTRLPDVPKFKLAINARYEFNIGSADAYFQGSLQHTGARFNDLFVARRQDQKAYSAVNLSAGFERDSWGGSIYVTNLTDTRAELNRNATTYDDRITTNRPRTIGVSVFKNF
ncbi:TonB-dependent receptor [Parasphingorhabdus sp.]|uniref:TonB-dependent receptor n=1 Tax=Parasphingorhabdus sp. TaxID=2709688 RepID=UPI0030A9C69C